ncbi:ABC transporter permease [Hyphococcus sp.]|uniref:ABC transporter permease n=1 Tax=Hyphococcus sp. TaxID=2038636 RepID=UPI003CCC283A
MSGKGAYLFRRVLMVAPVVFGVATIAFALMYLLPGDPASAMLARSGASAEQIAELRADMGLDSPFFIQYFHYIGNLLQGDLGRSIVSQEPVATLLWSRLPTTLELVFAALFIAVPIGAWLGVAAAINKDSWVDRAIIVLSSIGVSMPSFWLALMFILLFSVWLGWFPAFGAGGLAHLVLPAGVMAFGAVGTIARTARTSMLDVLKQDYIRTAWAKGLTRRMVLYKHALRNALIPIITIVGLQFGWLVSGSVIIESVFSRQGIGQLLLSSIIERDFPVVQGAILISALMYVLLNLLVDIIYAAVDPQISYE